jgi:hypothetical protein
MRDKIFAVNLPARSAGSLCCAYVPTLTLARKFYGQAGLGAKLGCAFRPRRSKNRRLHALSAPSAAQHNHFAAFVTVSK